MKVDMNIVADVSSPVKAYTKITQNLKNVSCSTKVRSLKAYNPVVCLPLN